MLFLFCFQFNQRFSCKSRFSELLLETQPAYVSQMIPNFFLISSSCFLQTYLFPIKSTFSDLKASLLRSAFFTICGLKFCLFFSI